MKKIIAGVDEVGRGSLIGPVFAAAVIFKTNIDKKKIKDSKKLSKEKRNILEKYIKKNSIWSIGSASLKEIEKLNILNEEKIIFGLANLSPLSLNHHKQYSSKPNLYGLSKS